MAIEPTASSAIAAQRANLLNQLGNSAQGSQAVSQQTTVDNVQSRVQQVQADEDRQRQNQPPPGRGEKYDFTA